MPGKLYAESRRLYLGSKFVVLAVQATSFRAVLYAILQFKINLHVDSSERRHGGASAC